MTQLNNRYEIRVEHLAGPGLGGPESNWSWSRLSQIGSILVHGTSHRSLEACFAAARNHREAFGYAPIRINLRGADEPEMLDREVGIDEQAPLSGDAPDSSR